MKTAIIKTRAVPEEKQALAQIAKQERLSMSETLRDLIRQEARRRGLWPPGSSEVVVEGRAAA
jgi:hypothetical protein